jgi:hypothetical protein
MMTQEEKLTAEDLMYLKVAIAVVQSNLELRDDKNFGKDEGKNNGIIAMLTFY